MAGVQVTENWDTRVTSTMRLWLKQKPVDQIFSGNLLLGILFGEQSAANKEKFGLRANRVIKQGGRKVAIPVRYNRSTNIASFSHADELPLNIDEVATMAEADWSYYRDAVVVTWQEATEGRGEAELFSILESRMEQALDTLKERVNTDLFSTGDGVSVGNSGKNIMGLTHLIADAPSSGIVWGLNRATYDWWRNQQVDAGNTFANVGLAKLANMWTTVSGTNGEDPPTILLTTSAQWEAYHADVAAKQQIMTTKVGDRGFPTLEFMGRPMFYSSGVPSHVWWFLNMNYMIAALQQGADFKVKPYGPGSGTQVLEGIWQILWGGQIGFERYDRQGHLLYTG